MTIKKFIPVLILIATGMVFVTSEAKALRLIEDDPYEADLSAAIDEAFSSSVGTEIFTSGDIINFDDPIIL